MSRESRFSVGVLGASGYIGAELLRYLSIHPRVEIAWKTAHSHEGARVADVLPNLRGFVDGVFERSEDAERRIGDVRAVFVALPHNQSQEVIPRLAERHPSVVFIDMAGDFRTNDPAGYARYYKIEHIAPDLLSRFVYGFTEFQRERLRGATLIANPGCFATAMLLALSPLARAGILPAEVCMTGITGSSGSGNKPAQTTHHPERATNLLSYKPLDHQHLLEVESFLRGISSEASRIQFVPQSGPFVRGIFLTVFLPGSSVSAVRDVLRESYSGEALIDVVDGSPQLRWVQGTPRSVIGVGGTKDRGAVVFAAIDNLGKGAAGQALQNLNLALGLPETEGLRMPGGFV
jgi:N-acetyl-gamma-glutamyl-phosphate/LysW-gamma-L-alpha-aminoadipyl-6-phosphate reductase